MTRFRLRGLAGIALGLLVTTAALAAVEFPRGTLWRVEQACMLNSRTTGSPFPCLSVDLAKGFVVLRAPFRQTHVVLMPTARVTGIEDPALRGPLGARLFAEAWNAREYVEAEMRRPLAWNDIGLAVNSLYTRSQDQLHIHVDCVRADVREDMRRLAAGLPTDAWQAMAFRFRDQAFWARRFDGNDLDGTNVARLVDEIAPLRSHPERTVLAVLGIAEPQGRNGYVLLAGESDPVRRASQWTSEDLLDHHCGRR